MSPEPVQSLIALVLGFAVAGLASSGYRLVTSRLPTFELLNGGARATTVAAVPVLVFAAPFLIMRNTLLGRRQERRRFQFVFGATLIAGLWSLSSGTVVVMALRAFGILT
jgi:hypothetical protein